mmetsp:Transcript_81398/g.264229  ORF Transcript_81398/g.264229 Transcript_81398/m.264229 type:complete len:270 (+) Transcript_81398:633-1442(+)
MSGSHVWNVKLEVQHEGSTLMSHQAIQARQVRPDISDGQCRARPEKPFPSVGRWQVHPQDAPPVAEELVLRQCDAQAALEQRRDGDVREEGVCARQPEQVVPELPQVMQGIAEGAAGCRIQPAHVVLRLPLPEPSGVGQLGESEGRWDVKGNLQKQKRRPDQSQQVLGYQAIVAVDVDDEDAQRPRRLHTVYRTAGNLKQSSQGRFQLRRGRDRRERDVHGGDLDGEVGHSLGALREGLLVHVHGQASEAVPIVRPQQPIEGVAPLAMS